MADRRGPKRFWTHAEAAPLEEGGYGVALDGKPVRTPAKALLRAPGRALAEAVAQEWNDQGAHLDPGSMPATRLLNSAIDRVAPQRAAVIDAVAAYGGSDLLCYRADFPEELVARQEALWEPPLRWAEDRYGLRMLRAVGVMHVAQPEASLTALRAAVAAEEDAALAALHELTALSGSLALGLGVLEAAFAPEEAWRASRVDEDWQAEQWGADAEAAATAAAKRAAFLDAAHCAALIRAGDKAPS